MAIKGCTSKDLRTLTQTSRGLICSVIDLVDKDEEVLLEEQAKLDDHEDKVTDLMSHLLNLGLEKRKVATPSVANPSKPFEKRLGFFNSKLRSISGKIVSLVPRPDFDLCLAQHLAERIGELKSELVNLTYNGAQPQVYKRVRVTRITLNITCECQTPV